MLSSSFIKIPHYNDDEDDEREFCIVFHPFCQYVPFIASLNSPNSLVRLVLLFS